MLNTASALKKTCSAFTAPTATTTADDFRHAPVSARWMYAKAYAAEQQQPRLNTAAQKQNPAAAGFVHSEA
jgi:hypothetical protein